MPLREFHPALSEEARIAINEALDAISTWHTEIASTSAKNTENVIGKMSVAAQALGWPQEIVEAIGAQMKGITKMQLELMGHIVDAWEAQIKSPDPMANFPTAMMSRLQSWPGGDTQQMWPNPEVFNQWTSNPTKFLMQMGEQWQKNWAQAMTFWATAGMPK